MADAEKWIPLAERTPPPFLRVLISDGVFVAEGYRTPENTIRRAGVLSAWQQYADNREPTHWMELPGVTRDKDNLNVQRWSGWTLCIDREPPPKKRVILTDGSNVAEGFRTPDGWYARPHGGDWRDTFGRGMRVCAWRPLPKPCVTDESEDGEHVE